MAAPNPRILVLGGGISGLLAAWHLRRRGLAVAVWEAGGAPGGWAQTLPWPGPRGEPGWLERGPHSLRVAPGGALDQVLEHLAITPWPAGPKGPRWLGRNGRRYPSPASLAGLLRAPGLGFGARLRLVAEPFIPCAPAAEETLQAFFARRLGEGFARECLPALVAGVLAAPPELLGRSALPRLRHLEARGGLLLGGLRLGAERTWIPAGGVGALAQALADQPGGVHLRRPARALEPLPGGRWRVHGEGVADEADAVVVALPSAAAATLLRPVAGEAAARLAAIPRLDLRVWHSRHRPVPGWERGFGLLIHPPEGRGLLGVVAFAGDDPRGVPGLLQLRTYLGGAYPVAPEMESWPGVIQALRQWLPELGEALQVREEACPGAFPRLGPGHATGLAELLGALPPTLHWVGAARFGPGLPDLAEGMAAWALSLPAPDPAPGPGGSQG